MARLRKASAGRKTLCEDPLELGELAGRCAAGAVRSVEGLFTPNAHLTQTWPSLFEERVLGGIGA